MKTVAWHKRIGVRLGGVTLLLLAVSLLLILGAFYTLSSMQGDAASLSLFGKGRMQLYQLLYIAHLAAAEQNDAKSQARAELGDMNKAFEERLRQLEKGDPAADVPAATNPIILKEIQDRREAWENKMKPLVDDILLKTKGDDAAKDASRREAVAKDLSELDDLARKGMETLNDGIKQYQDGLTAKAQRFYWVLLGFGILVLAVTGLVLRIAWGVAHRTQTLARTADRIAGGELSVTAPIAGGDELAVLGEAFNTMTGNLRSTIEAEQQRRQRIEQLIENIREAVGQLTSSSAEVLASATQQAAGAREQAAAVTETVATVDEVTQTSEQSTQRARRWPTPCSAPSRSASRVGRRRRSRSRPWLGCRSRWRRRRRTSWRWRSRPRPSARSPPPWPTWPSRRTCWRSTRPSRPAGRASTARASPWWPARSRRWPTSPRRPRPRCGRYWARSRRARRRRSCPPRR